MQDPITNYFHIITTNYRVPSIARIQDGLSYSKLKLVIRNFTHDHYNGKLITHNEMNTFTHTNIHTYNAILSNTHIEMKSLFFHLFVLDS